MSRALDDEIAAREARLETFENSKRGVHREQRARRELRLLERLLRLREGKT